MPDLLSFDDTISVLDAIARMLSEAPLYSQLVYQDKSQTYVLPEAISIFCETCDKDTNWDTYIVNTNYRAGFGEKEYKCRNCRQQSANYFYYWGKANSPADAFLFFKIGQWPALEERIPRELMKGLDRPSQNLYHKALRCRNQNLGLGSLGYLRRVVEDKINAVLDMIAEESEQIGFQAGHLAKLQEVKEKGLFKDKIEFASVILPPSLRPGGHNPIDALHDLASDGTHHLSEDECVRIFDRVRAVFEYLFREIDTRRRSAAEYAASLAKLASARK
jgi:hypothetical protein